MHSVDRWTKYCATPSLNEIILISITLVPVKMPSFSRSYVRGTRPYNVACYVFFLHSIGISPHIAQTRNLRFNVCERCNYSTRGLGYHLCSINIFYTISLGFILTTLVFERGVFARYRFVASDISQTGINWMICATRTTPGR